MINTIIVAGAPFALAALGGLISEKSGVLNIALEGCIGLGAFVSVVLIAVGIPVPVAIIASMAAGALVGLLLAGVHLKLSANLFVAGLGINLMIPSITGLISQLLRGNKGTIPLPDAYIGLWPEYLVPIVSWTVIPLGLAMTYLLGKTAFGRRIRTAGTTPEFLSERGISPSGIKTAALTISSSAAALAGVLLSLRIGAYVSGISAGRGWISLVIIWLGFKRPWGILIAAYFFSLMEIISNRAQGIPGTPSTLFLAFPYIAALAALVISSARKKSTRSRH